MVSQWYLKLFIDTKVVGSIFSDVVESFSAFKRYIMFLVVKTSYLQILM